MSKVEKFARIIVKTLQTSAYTGVTATIPPSNDHTTLPEWSPSDIYVGEFLLNSPDRKLFMRLDNSTIKRVAFYEDLSGSTSGFGGTSGTSGVDGNPNFGTSNDLFYDTSSHTLVTPNLLVYTGISYLANGYNLSGKTLITDGSGKLIYGDFVPDFGTSNDLFYDTSSQTLVTPNLQVNTGMTYLADGYGEGKILISDAFGNLKYGNISLNSEKFYILKGYTQNSGDVLPGVLSSDTFVKEFKDFDGNDCKVGSGWTFNKSSDNEFEIHNSNINLSGGTGIYLTTFYKITNNGSGVRTMSTFTPNVGPNVYNNGKIVFSNIGTSSWGLVLGTDFYLILGFKEMPLLPNGYFI